jgi:hypothetical protein
MVRLRLVPIADHLQRTVLSPRSSSGGHAVVAMMTTPGMAMLTGVTMTTPHRDATSCVVVATLPALCRSVVVSPSADSYRTPPALQRTMH